MTGRALIRAGRLKRSLLCKAIHSGTFLTIQKRPMVKAKGASQRLYPAATLLEGMNGRELAEDIAKRRAGVPAAR
jgi:hypothetical protein